MDKIHIRDLSLRAVIGTYDWERTIKQDILFNIELRCELRKAGKSDSLEDTVNYKELKRRIIAHVDASNYKLIEALAESVAEICLEFDGVESVKLTLDKPGALRYAKSVAVEIERSKN